MQGLRSLGQVDVERGSFCCPVPLAPCLDSPASAPLSPLHSVFQLSQADAQVAQSCSKSALHLGDLACRTHPAHTPRYHKIFLEGEDLLLCAHTGSTQGVYLEYEDSLHLDTRYTSPHEPLGYKIHQGLINVLRLYDLLD